MPNRAVLIRATALLSFGLPWLVLFLQDQDVIWRGHPEWVVWHNRLEWVVNGLTVPWVVTVIGSVAFAALPWVALLLFDWVVGVPRPAAHSASRRSFLRGFGPFLVAGADLALILYWQKKRARPKKQAPQAPRGRSRFNF